MAFNAACAALALASAAATVRYWHLIKRATQDAYDRGFTDALGSAAAVRTLLADNDENEADDEEENTGTAHENE